MIAPPKEIIFDLDSWDDKIHGHHIQGSRYNGYYRQKMFHPLACFDGHTGDCLRAVLRSGEKYTSSGVTNFIRPLINRYSKIIRQLILRGDSGFAIPSLYRICEQNNNRVIYFIRLKHNAVLERKFNDIFPEDWDTTKTFYGEFTYQAQSWERPRRVLVKAEFPPSGLPIPSLTFIVTNDDTITVQRGIEFYCARGTMENYIKEGKIGFHFDRLSCKSFNANAARFQMMLIAYNLNNLMRRLCLPDNFKHHHINTIRLKLIKLGSRVSRHSRKIIIHCSSAFLFQDAFIQTLLNIQSLPFIPSG